MHIGENVVEKLDLQREATHFRAKFGSLSQEAIEAKWGCGISNCD